MGMFYEIVKQIRNPETLRKKEEHDEVVVKGEIGVSGKVELASKTVNIEYDESKVTLDTVKNAIEDQGYDVE